MKFLHMADLHLGKRVNGFSMLPDQKYILEQTLGVVCEEKPDALLLAGDIYDKAVPPAEAVQLFDWFLTQLAALDVRVFFIGGNHDSPERLSFATTLLQKEGIYGVSVFQKEITPVYLEDVYGKAAVYLIPYFRPSQAAVRFPEEEIETCEQAYEVLIRRMQIDTSIRNVLVAHAFVRADGETAADMSEQETAADTFEGLEEWSEAGASAGLEGVFAPGDREPVGVGGLERIDAELFSAFDYVALGHLHRPQKVGRGTVRYAGSPLKYSFSEALYEKSLVFIDMREKGYVEIKKVPLKPMHDMRILKGPIGRLLSPDVYKLGNTEDYVHVTLTDEEEILDAISRVRRIYPNVMQLEFERSADFVQLPGQDPEPLKQRSLSELFTSFYREQNQKEPSDVQVEYVQKYLETFDG